MEEKEQSVIKYKSRDNQDIELSFEIVKQFLIQGKKELITPQELFFFMGVCKSRGLNPFKKDAYLIKYSNDPAAIVTSIDFYRSRARAQEDCVGWKSGIIIKKGNAVEYREGNLLLEGEVLLGGWFEGKPKNWTETFRHSVNLRPYIKKTKEGEITRFWSEDNQPMMIQKVAEAQGLRKLWPDQFQQIYYEGEIMAEERDPTSEMESLGEYGRKAIAMPQEKKNENESEQSEQSLKKEGETIITGIDSVTEKDGKGKDNKPYTIYTLVSGSKKFTTFSKTIAEAAKKSLADKVDVKIEFKTTTYGLEIISLEIYKIL
jgi:phage recombination protein Bet